MKSQRAKKKRERERERENGARGGVAVRCRVEVIYGFGHVNPGKVICETHSYCVIFKARHKELLSSAWGSLCNVAVVCCVGRMNREHTLAFLQAGLWEHSCQPCLSPISFHSTHQESRQEAQSPLQTTPTKKPRTLVWLAYVI